MRRGIAIFLALAFSSLLVLPAFAGPAQSNLPACCRKTGKHHCSLHLAKSETNAGMLLTTVSGPCPYYPCLAGPAQLEISSPTVSRALVAAFGLQAGLIGQAEAGYQPVSDVSSNQKRGPPSFVLS
jgi:hypothetical protein